MRFWESKFLLCLLEIGDVNEFSLYGERNHCSFLRFTDVLSSNLASLKNLPHFFLISVIELRNMFVNFQYCFSFVFVF